MHKVSIVIAISLVLAVVFTATAQQPAVDLEAVMKQVQPIWSGLPARVSAKDTAGIAIDAVKLEVLFTDAQRFFQTQKMQHAAEWAQGAADAAASAAMAARAGKVDSAARQGIAINCKQCHDQYTTKGADGAFSLKQN